LYSKVQRKDTRHKVTSSKVCRKVRKKANAKAKAKTKAKTKAKVAANTQVTVTAVASRHLQMQLKQLCLLSHLSVQHKVLFLAVVSASTLASTP
jgi:hypothetical protein